MLTELKVSSLACICVLYRPEHNAKGDPMDINFKGLETKKLKRLIPGVMVIKMPKMTHFLYFLMTAKNEPQLGRIFQCISKIGFRSFRKHFRLLGSELPLTRFQPLRIHN